MAVLEESHLYPGPPEGRCQAPEGIGYLPRHNEPVLPAGTFLRAYAGNQQNAVEAILDGDPVVVVVQKIAPWA